MKYIPADKLIAEIERYENTAIDAYNPLGEDADFWYGKVVAFEDLKTLIISLQQEQPKEICFKCIYYEKDDGYCYYPHGGMQSKINENGVYECTGFYEKEQEQPEMDLEKGLADYCRRYYNYDYPKQAEEGTGSSVMPHIIEAARYFYELGSNARK